MKRSAFFSLAAALVIFFAPSAHASYDTEDTTVSTAPIGSPFYRHLAADLNVDLRELEKFEKRGFGRAEIVTIVLISKISQKPLKDYGKRRIKDKVLLKDFAAEANLDYPTLEKTATVIKQGIEAKGDNNLPPPLFELPKTDDKDKKKKKGATGDTRPGEVENGKTTPDDQAPDNGKPVVDDKAGGSIINPPVSHLQGDSR